MRTVFFFCDNLIFANGVRRHIGDVEKSRLLHVHVHVDLPTLVNDHHGDMGEECRN